MRSTTPNDVHAIADAVILDVREPGELAQARIEGTLDIPLGELVERVEEVPSDTTVYVLCHVGGRSAQAVQYLESRGVDAVNIDGGIVAWHRAGLPVTLGGAS
ncbi:rhodanese-like domain-containing protein [Agromyces fucosus]|uniref:Rhodanese-like domain-containing protein n=1 Tax=Agromyces fucosus TaxID=41985 RepID=A0A4Q2JPD1_9MICO|nr:MULTISPECIES: rhodanese-like domain-containing protein [Agromyces]KQZ10636.1 sulfurtransferase [Agromyces sp. Root1464]RXZ48539.1 rhodanese-like domain-containing protein [Agromyces fucosus]